MVQRDGMAIFEVRTRDCVYPNIIERGALKRVRNYLPKTASSLFVVTTQDVWQLHGDKLRVQLPDSAKVHTLFFPGGEVNKRLASVEALADQMLAAGADRTSIVIGFGGGIVTDLSGFLAAIYMRGVPVLQIPTTLLAQVDAATGGKTGVNLTGGKNLIGSFHQPLAVVIDSELLETLPAREVRAGLFEVLKCGVIRDPALFTLLAENAQAMLAFDPDLLDQAIAAAVRIKAEVVSADEREGGLRRILNFGHTIGHALEAETQYQRYLHGEAVGWGMLAATELAAKLKMLDRSEAGYIAETVKQFGPLPPAHDLSPENLLARLSKDKKTMAGRIHFVLPTAIGKVDIRSGIDESVIREAIVDALQ
jgi:3-dehydroquinate synthase